MDLNNKNIIVSRTDSIGDVMLSLPICAWLKNKFPEVRITFLGKAYTRPVLDAYSKIDKFEDWDDYEGLPKAAALKKIMALNADAIIHVFPDKKIASLAKKAGITMRVGSSHRVYHLTTCTHRVNFTRKRSDLHESQLNHELLRPFGLKEIPKISDIIAATAFFTAPEASLPKKYESLSSFTILHPKSQGSAKEWPLEKYLILAKELIANGETVVFTGTENEGKSFRDQLPLQSELIDTTGKMSLTQLILFISKAKSIVACSTGPLHIGSFLGINSVGLYSPKRPIHPGRWGALGSNVSVLMFDKKCPECLKGNNCSCIEDIEVGHILDKVI